MKSLTLITLLIALLFAAGALTGVQAQSRLTAGTTGFHATTFSASTTTTPWYGGQAIFLYNRTFTATVTDTIVLTGYDSTCAVYLARDGGNWHKLVAALPKSNYPTITPLALGPLGNKVKYFSVSYALPDTILQKLIIIKTYKK
jgi:hypothetical protein